MKREANQTQERFYNKHTCREVSPGLDAPPSLAGSFPNSPSEARWVRETSSHPKWSNHGLTEPATMFGFYHMPFR
jgi:hypothetical protein